MTIQRPALSAAAKKTAAVAALLLAATGAATVPAWADSHPVTPCTHGSVTLPGETPVAGGPAHHGSPTLATSLVGTTSSAGRTSFEVQVTATNHTGAGYQHVTLVPSFFTTLGVMNQGNTVVQWVHGGGVVDLPTRPGCDPTVFVDSAALDSPLADGQSVSYDLRITTPTTVAEQVKNYFLVGTEGAADGQAGLTSNELDLMGQLPTAQPTPSQPAPSQPAPSHQPTTAPTPVHKAAPAPAAHTSAPAAPAVAPVPAAPAPVASASAAPASAPAAAPTPATSDASLAFTGGGGNSGTLFAGAAALLAAGGAVLFGLKRRARRGN
ncbi:hypothetical protein ACIGXM_03380 [Kitasatospora sp. NPDC052896]|uniref:hypothetical protein n=1 Tax=Kitasatospora sp. NPDC052896 TaxID=3364061 RepID=UPI0037C8889A